MDIAALTSWVLTALGGSYLLMTWLIRGGMRQRKAKATSFPAPLIFGHFLLAATGLGCWIAYVLTDISGLAWAALSTLLLVAVLGFTMFLRWGGEAGHAGVASPGEPTMSDDLVLQRGTAATARTTRPPSVRGGGIKDAAVTTAREPAEQPAESHFPIVVVAAHGALAVSTFSLVLLAALGIGS